MLILDRHHFCLLAGDALPATAPLTLPAPSGPSVYVLQERAAPPGEGWRWVRLSEMARGGTGYWPLYRDGMLGGYEPPKRDLDVIYFGNTPLMAAQLAHLVVKGRKRATSGWIEAMKAGGEALPYPGLITVVTDWFGFPQCLIETVETRTVPFGEVAEDVAYGEGEGDRTLADWRRGHFAYFEAEARALGIPFSEKSLILNEFFRVIKVLGNPPAN